MEVKILNKKFNITGTCIPDKHYMVDITTKINYIMKLIENEEYFIINRPRQYGKTTTLYLLNKKLSKMDDYLSIKISFESIDSDSFGETKSFLKSIMIQMRNYFRFTRNKTMLEYINKYCDKITRMAEFSDFITDMVEYVDRKVVLIIDEVDKSSNNQLFLDFLGLLRNKYLSSKEDMDITFSSVILAGVHDVKSLKIKIRSDQEHKYNSPWNIAADFDVDMSFSEREIETMLDEYTRLKNIELDKKYFAERLYFYTSGHPFLVSKLCKTIDEKILSAKDTMWEREYIDIAVKEVLKENNTNFDSVIKNIENNSELYSFTKRIILDGENITYVRSDEIVNFGSIYGILKDEKGNCRINNKIYEQLIYNHMMMKLVRNDRYKIMSDYNYKSKFINEDNTLDIEKILMKFQEFMKKEYSAKKEAFLEDDGRLILLAFISPIINGAGFAFKEVKGGEEKRFDIVITYGKEMHILELKIWRGEQYHKKGLIQLGEYLEQYGLDKGYLLVFDFRKQRGESGKTIETKVNIGGREKKILEVYC